MGWTHARIELVTMSLLIFVSAAHAAPIAWLPAQDTTGPSDVVSGGTVILARNATNASDYIGVQYTVGDVTFTGERLLWADPVINGAGPAILFVSSGHADYDSIIGTADYGRGGDLAIAEALMTVEGLTPGKVYYVQVWYNDNRANPRGREMIISDDEPVRNSVIINSDPSAATDPDGGTGTSMGQFALGTFTASGTTQGVYLTANGFANAHYSALLVREVPEPAALALLLVGGVMVLPAGRQRGR